VVTARAIEDIEDDLPQVPLRPLGKRQKAFVEAYLRLWNATQAAREAGYAERSLRQIGSANLAKPNIAAAISERLAEMTMGADEVLVLLSEHARGRMDDFLDPESTVEPSFDLAQALQAGKGKLIKKLTLKRRYGGRDDDAWEERSVTLELYDAQAAAVWIAKHHGLLTESFRFTGDLTKMSDDELDELAAKLASSKSRSRA
jgi:phage terminase small subunit